MSRPRTQGRRRGAAAIFVVALVVVAGCGHGRDRRDDDPVPLSNSSDGLCRILSVPLKYAGPAGISFIDLVDGPESADRGTGAALAFGLASDPDQAGEFRPVLRFLAERSVATFPPTGSAPPTPVATEAIRENAEALDRALANGRCD